MADILHCFLISLFLASQHLVKCNPAKENDIQEEPEEVDQDQFVTDLRRYVLSVPISSFEGDAVLLQFPDPLNKKTSYRHLDPLDAIGEVVYETKGDDTDRQVVILNSYEDAIPLPKGDKVKRAYVILRRAIQIEPRVYFVSYLYVTEAPENTPGIHNLGSRKVFLEWDFWDHRESIDPRAKSLENAFRCGNSIFVPCASKETIDYPLPPSRPENSNVPETSYPAANPKVVEVYKVAEGYDPDEFMDIYGDLDREVRIHKDLSEIPSDTEPSPPYIGRGKFFNKNVSLSGIDVPNQLINKAVNVVDNAALGLTKDYQGLYGGLGTPDATLASVGIELGIEGTDDLDIVLNPEELQALELGVKQKTAGGLGGLITSLEDDEAPSDLTIDQQVDLINPSVSKGRTAIGTSWVRPAEEENPYIGFGWTKTNGPTTATEPFVGFGACRYLSVKPAELNRINNFDDHLRVYQRALKTQCVGYDTDFLTETHNSGLLIAGPNHTLDLNKDAIHFTTEKLTVKQVKELLRGVQLAMFSRAYNNELVLPTQAPKGPDGLNLGRSVHTLGQMIIGSTAYSQANLWVDLRHGFKLNRNLIRTLKIFYQKLGEDKELLGDSDTNLDKEINYNNRVYVMGIIQYLMRGSAPVYNSPVNPQKTFEAFFSQNKQIIEDRVNSRGK